MVYGRLGIKCPGLTNKGVRGEVLGVRGAYTLYCLGPLTPHAFTPHDGMTNV